MLRGNVGQGHGNVAPLDAVDGKAVQDFEMATEVEPDAGPCPGPQGGLPGLQVLTGQDAEREPRPRLGLGPGSLRMAVERYLGKALPGDGAGGLELDSADIADLRTLLPAVDAALDDEGPRVPAQPYAKTRQVVVPDDDVVLPAGRARPAIWLCVSFMSGLREAWGGQLGSTWDRKIFRLVQSASHNSHVK
jgi:hypothetical protein